jgi:hypothetical protein
MVFTGQERLESAIYKAIEALIINQILAQAEQRTKEESKSYRKQELKVIHKLYQRLLKLKYRLSEKTLQEMIDDLTYSNEFLPTVSAEYLEGTTEEKQKIINSLELEKLNRDTFALVTTHLKRKGCLNKIKGFTGETVI